MNAAEHIYIGPHIFFQKMKRIFIHLLVAIAPFAATRADNTAFGYQFDSKTNRQGFVSWDINAPQTLNPQTSLTYNTDIRLSAGEYVDGKLYGYTVEVGDPYDLDYTIVPYGWVVYDAETLKKLDSNYSLDKRVVDMTYDYTTNTMYALIENKYTTGTVIQTSLCAVDMSTGKYRVIGDTGTIKAVSGTGATVSDGLLTLACDANGQLYAMSHYRYLYKVDKFTGRVHDPAPQHNLGTINQFQSMAFAADGTLWWAQGHPDYSHFCSIDLETGIPGGFVDFHTDYEKLNKLGDDDQVTCLYFKDKEINRQSPLAVTNLNATSHDNGVNKVDLTWELPTEDYAGEPVEVLGVTVYRIGTSEPIGTAPAGATSFTDEDAPNGFVTYEVIPFSAAGNGFPAFIETFAGFDQLNKVENISLSVDGRDITVQWEKPTSTVNGGYADYDAITYNVYRCMSEEEELVAENIDATSFNETIAADGKFFYIIEAMCGGIVGLRGESDSFILSSPASVPYSTGFEDEQDGPMWTFINVDSYYGWKIYSGSRSTDGGKYAEASTGSSAALGNDWLVSPAIEITVPGIYILSFDANGGSFKGDLYTVDVKLGTDSADPESFTQDIHSFVSENVYNSESTSYYEKDKWLSFSYELNIEAAGLYHIGFHNKTTVTYTRFAVDNLSLIAKDSGVSSSVNDDVLTSINVNGDQIDIAAPADVVKVELFDLSGRRAMSVDAESSNVTINASNLASGVYIISVTLEDGNRHVAKATIM